MRTVTAEPVEADDTVRVRRGGLFEVGVEYEFHLIAADQGMLHEDTIIRTVRAVDGPLLRVVATTRVRFDDDQVAIETAEDYSEEILNTHSYAFVRAVRRDG